MPDYAFVCNKAVCGSSMWHALEGKTRKVDCRVGRAMRTRSSQ
jgi:hypothetical protein